VHPNVVCDRSGRRLLAVDYPRSQAILFNLEQPGKKLVLSHRGVNGCALSRDGRWAFTWSDSASQQFDIHVWSTAKGKLVRQLPAGERVSYFTPDGRWLVTAPPGDVPLRKWEIAPAPATSSAAADTKTCPMCAEDVKAAAVLCRFCGHRFDQ
jgi:WD40 repeat protein